MFAVRDALAAGVGYGRTRGKDLIAPFHGTRSPADQTRPTALEARIAHLAHLYVPRLLEGQFFCGPTALALHGLPVPSTASDEVVHIAVRKPRTPPRAAGVSGHRFTVGSLTSVQHAPVVTPLEAWAQSASSATVDDLTVIGDALVRRVKPHATIAALEQTVVRWRGRRGARFLARAVLLVRARTDSPAETRARLAIVRAGLPEPVVNLAITSAAGRFLGFGDLAYPGSKIVIEYEGAHHFQEAQLYHDIDRLAAFVEAGWLVVRLHKHHLRQPASIVSKVRAALDARSAR